MEFEVIILLGCLYTYVGKAKVCSFTVLCNYFLWEEKLMICFLSSESLYEDEEFDQHQRQLAALLVSKVKFSSLTIVLVQSFTFLSFLFNLNYNFSPVFR